MKKTNRIISLILSTQLVAMSALAGPVSLQKQPKLRTEATVPLGSKDKKSIDAKTIAKKTVLFPLKALWWVTKPQLIMLGTGIFDLSLLVGYGGYKAYKWCDKHPVLVEFAKSFAFSGDQSGCIPLSDVQTNAICADMRYCLAKMKGGDGSVSSETSSEYKNIAEKYSSLTDTFKIMEEFLSHFELINKYLIEITENLKGLPEIPIYVYNKKYCIFAFDKSFNHAGDDLRTIVTKFYRQCALIVHPDKHKLDGQEKKAKEIFQKLDEWKDTMYKILDK